MNKVRKLNSLRYKINSIFCDDKLEHRCNGLITCTFDVRIIKTKNTAD